MSGPGGGGGEEEGVKYVDNKFDQYGNNGTRFLVNTSDYNRSHKFLSTLKNEN